LKLNGQVNAIIGLDGAAIFNNQSIPPLLMYLKGVFSRSGSMSADHTQKDLRDKIGFVRNKFCFFLGRSRQHDFGKPNSMTMRSKRIRIATAPALCPKKKWL
jgi:hypothetical protein